MMPSGQAAAKGNPRAEGTPAEVFRAFLKLGSRPLAARLPILAISATSWSRSANGSTRPDMPTLLRCASSCPARPAVRWASQSASCAVARLARWPHGRRSRCHRPWPCCAAAGDRRLEITRCCHRRWLVQHHLFGRTHGQVSLTHHTFSGRQGQSDGELHRPRAARAADSR